MAERTNIDRRRDANAALCAYIETGAGDKDDHDSSMVDLMADLLHLLNANGYPPEDAVAVALMHFTAENNGEA